VFPAGLAVVCVLIARSFVLGRVAPSGTYRHDGIVTGGFASVTIA